MEELVQRWKERLKRFQENPNVAKGMNPLTAMGAQHGRTVALKHCIKEIEEIIKKSNDKTVDLQ